MIPALATLLVFQLLGEALVLALAMPVPGPVVGLALLLLKHIDKPDLLARLRSWFVLLREIWRAPGAWCPTIWW